MTNILVVEEKNINSYERCEVDEIFCINDQLNKIDRDQYDKLYRIISDAKVDTGTQVPVYDIAWQHMSHRSYGRLHELTLLGERFQTYLEDFPNSNIICDKNLDKGHQIVINEVGESIGCDVHNATKAISLFDKVRQVFMISIMILPFLFNQLVAIILYKFRSPPQPCETIFVPNLGRLNSMIPVIEKASFDYQLVVSTNTSSLYSTSTTQELNKYDPISASAYTNIQCILQQFKSYLSITRSVFFKKTISNELTEVFENKTGIKFNNTVQYSVLKTFQKRMFIAFLKYILFRKVISKTSAEKVVVGTMSPNGRSIVRATIDKNGLAFHIPHSIASYVCPNPPRETIQFVAGSLEKQYYTESPQVAEPWRVITTGRPYLIDLYKQKPSLKNDQYGTYRLLIATQPLPQKKKFVREIIKSINQVDLSWEIILKIHPNENPDEYNEIIGNQPNIVIKDGDLFSHLSNSDLTVTISSNVGLESILLGTPTIVFNKWRPVNMDPLYAMYGPIPIFRTCDDLRDFFVQTHHEELTKLQKDELVWVKDSYVLNVDASENMAKMISRAPGHLDHDFI